MARRGNGIGELSLFRGVRSVASRCAGILGQVLTSAATREAEIPDTLKVEVLSVTVNSENGGKCRAHSRLSVANLSLDLVERLTLSLTLKQDGVDPLYTVEHTYDVHVEPGDFVEIDLDLGNVPLDESLDGLTAEVHALASRHANRSVPTYVLPDSSTGVCAIEDSCTLARDIALERIDISLSRNLLRNRGWARVMYVIRNESGTSHSSLSLVTRFSSLSGEVLGEAKETFTLGALGQSRITAKVTLRQVRGLGATRFHVEFDGFEDIGRGMASYRGIRIASVAADESPHTWEGEELKGAYWINRPSS